MALVFALQLSADSELRSCHIHPPTAPRDLEPEDRQSYSSLEICEDANRRLYGGSGRCHCISDFFMNRESIDGWRQRLPGDTSPERLP
jgi:hypothetical protein